MGLPHVTVGYGPRGNPIYQVGGKSFVFFRNPRPDAVDPATGERYPDVIVFWAASESGKQALIQDQASPFFTTPHFDGHPSVLVRGSRIGELTVQELAEVIQDAWLSRASPAGPRDGRRRYRGLNGTRLAVHQPEPPARLGLGEACRLGASRQPGVSAQVAGRLEIVEE